MRKFGERKSMKTAAAFVLVFVSAICAAVGLTHFTENHRWYADEKAENAVWVADGGAAVKAPDHTSAAFVRAGQSGAYGGMMGTVQVSKDGVLVMLREDTVNRMTDEKGKVQKFTYAELLQLQVDGGNGKDLYTEVQITALQDFLRICRNYKLTPILRLGRGVELNAVLEALEEFELTDKAVIVSESKKELRRIHAQSSEIGLFWKTNSISKSKAKFCAENDMVLFFKAENSKNTNKAIAKAAETGAVLGVWSDNPKTDGTRFMENRVTYVAASMPQIVG